ncbi:MAG TPA: hypothetical protein V6C98_18180 [Thermosynechococcaceae cyanobacterium]
MHQTPAKAVSCVCARIACLMAMAIAIAAVMPVAVTELLLQT